MTLHFITSYQQLPVYQMAFQGSITTYHWVRPLLETSEADLLPQLSATAQAVRAHIVAAWRQRQHQAAFVSELSLAQLAVTEMQRWIEAAIIVGHFDPDAGQDLYDHYRDLYAALDQLMAAALAVPHLVAETAATPLPATA